MGEVVSKLAFKSGNSVAVHLPKHYGIEPGMEITVEKRGHEVVIRPKRQSITEMVRKLRALPVPDHVQERDADIFPDRKTW